MCVVAFKLKKKKKEDKVRNVWSSNSPRLRVFPDFFFVQESSSPMCRQPTSFLQLSSQVGLERSP